MTPKKPATKIEKLHQKSKTCIKISKLATKIAKSASKIANLQHRKWLSGLLFGNGAFSAEKLILVLSRCV